MAPEELTILREPAPVDRQSVYVAIFLNAVERDDNRGTAQQQGIQPRREQQMTESVL
jgi:hypothetical protein